ncbi:WD40-repeat-containing domain protein [Irpex lacteus]|nr:WD40-repeat-containing domain protein [Irpex lacteus]
MLQNHDSWCNFASGDAFELGCKPDEIVFIKGFVKTSAWSVAAYRSGVRSTQTMALTGTVGGVGEAGFEFNIDSSEGYIFDTRYGPEGREAQTPLLRSHSPRPSIASGKGKSPEILQEDSLSAITSQENIAMNFPRDQSVFVSYYKIKHRIWWMRKIVANAGPHELPRGPDEDQPTAVLAEFDMSVEEVPARRGVRYTQAASHSGSTNSTCAYYLSMILQNSDAEVAIASHDDLAGLFPGDFWPQNIAAQLQQDRPAITVDENNVFGYIALQDIIVRQRTEALLNAVARQDQVEQEEQDKQTAIAQTLQREEDERKQRAAEAQAEAEAEQDGQDDQLLAEASSSEPVSEQSTTGIVHPEEATPEDHAPPVDTPFIPPSGLTDKPSRLDPAPPSSELSQYERYPSLRSTSQGRQYGSSVQLDGQIYLGNDKLIKYPHMILADHVADGCAVTSIAISPATNRLSTTCEDRAVRVWDLVTGALLMKLDDHKGILWNLDSHYQIAQLEGHTGDYIATGSTDCMVKLWDGADGKPLVTIQDHAAVVMSVTFSSDSQRVLSCADNYAYVWNNDGSPFSADGTRAVTAAEDETTRIWDVQTGAELVLLAEHSGPVWSAAFSPDGDDVVSGSYDGRVTLCDSYTGQEKYSFEDDHPSIVNTVAYSKDGEFVVVGCADGAVKVWNVKSGEFVAELMGHEDKVKDVAFSPDDCHVISCSDDSTVRIWNIVDILRL